MAQDFGDHLTHNSPFGSPQLVRDRPQRPAPRFAEGTTVPRFGLDYNPRIDAMVLCDLEQAARDVGLPLWQVELLGQHSAAALGFVHAVHADSQDAYLAAMDWDGLEGILRGRN